MRGLLRDDADVLQNSVTVTNWDLIAPSVKFKGSFLRLEAVSELKLKYDQKIYDDSQRRRCFTLELLSFLFAGQQGGDCLPIINNSNKGVFDLLTAEPRRMVDQRHPAGPKGFSPLLI